MAVSSELKAAQVEEESVPPRWVDETSREHGERRAQHDHAGRAEADRSDAAVLRQRADIVSSGTQPTEGPGKRSELSRGRRTRPPRCVH